MDVSKTGEFLRKLRKEQNLTQEQLGEKIGVDNKTVSRYETGKYVPPVDILLQLSALYNVTVNELLSGERLATADYQHKAEENIVASLKKSQKLSRSKKTLIICISVITALALVLLGLYLFFISLFPGANGVALFAEGTYEYCGEPFELANGVFVEGVKLEFKQIDKQSFAQANGINVVQNYANDRMYKLKLSVKVVGGDYVDYYLKERGSLHSFYRFDLIDGADKPLQLRDIIIDPVTDEYDVMRSMEVVLHLKDYDEILTNKSISLKIR